MNEALAIYRELGDALGQANALNNLGFQAYFQGNLEAAVGYWRDSMDARDRAGDVVGKATQQNNIGEALCDLGDLAGAEEMFREALSVWRAARYSIGIALATSNLGWVAHRAGRYEEAERLLGEAFTLFEEIASRDYIAQTLIRLLENDLAQGDTVQARRRLETSESRMGHLAASVQPDLAALREKIYQPTE
jgi:tetratricopeptide (TPR) repeat protein